MDRNIYSQINRILVANNTWVHAVAVYDGTVMRLYKDGHFLHQNSRQRMKYKIIGTIFMAMGFFLIVKYNHYLIGLILLIVGFILAKEFGFRSD